MPNADAIGAGSDFIKDNGVAVALLVVCIIFIGWSAIRLFSWGRDQILAKEELVNKSYIDQIESLKLKVDGLEKQSLSLRLEARSLKNDAAEHKEEKQNLLMRIDRLELQINSANAQIELLSRLIRAPENMNSLLNDND